LALDPYDHATSLPYLAELADLLETFAYEGERLASLPEAEGEALQRAARYLGVAYDHLVTFEMVVVYSHPTWAAYTLLRPALEASQRANWLTSVTGPDRVRRSLSDEWETARENRRDVQAMLGAAGDDPLEEVAAGLVQLRERSAARLAAILRRSAELEVPVARRRHRTPEGHRQPPETLTGPSVAELPPSQVAWVGERYPGASELLREFLHDHPEFGPLLYRRMSSAVHGRFAGTNPTVDRSDGDPREGDAVRVSVNDHELETARTSISGAVVLAAGALAEAAGYCRHRVMLADRGMSDHRRYSGHPRPWPPPATVQFNSSPINARCPCCGDLAVHLFASAAGKVRWCRRCPPAGSDRHLYEHVTGHRLPQYRV
jgi:hypothetical protein